MLDRMAKRKRRGRGRPARPDALYRGLAAALRERISGGDWPPGTVLPSLRALAAEYGAGENTVRQAVALLKRERRIKVSPWRRLVAADPQGAWTAAGLLVLHAISGALNGALRARYLPEVIRGVQIGAGERNSPILILHGRHLRHNLPTDALELPVRGIVLTGSFTRKILGRYANLGVPVVLTDRPGKGLKVHSVGVDNVAGAREATARLIAMGHKRIAFVRFVLLGVVGIDPDSAERQEGFLAALEAAGLPRGSGQVFNAFSSDTSESPSMRAIFETTPKFTAVLTASGGRARVVAEAAEAAGRSVPRDLSVISFQGQRASFPRFSGPRADFEEIGRRAVELLDAPRHPPQHARVPAVWADGETVAPVRRRKKKT